MFSSCCEHNEHPTSPACLEVCIKQTLPECTTSVACWMQGLQKLHQEHDKGHVHLQLSFKRGLHPFYPPLLDVLYPRFKGPVAGALTSHPVTQLQHWDPWITQRELVTKLKAFLEVGRYALCVHTCVHILLSMLTVIPSRAPQHNAARHASMSSHFAFFNTR